MPDGQDSGTSQNCEHEGIEYYDGRFGPMFVEVGWCDDCGELVHHYMERTNE